MSHTETALTTLQPLLNVVLCDTPYPYELNENAQSTQSHAIPNVESAQCGQLWQQADKYLKLLMQNNSATTEVVR